MKFLSVGSSLLVVVRGGGIPYHSGIRSLRLPRFRSYLDASFHHGCNKTTPWNGSSTSFPSPRNHFYFTCFVAVSFTRQRCSRGFLPAKCNRSVTFHHSKQSKQSHKVKSYVQSYIYKPPLFVRNLFYDILYFPRFSPILRAY